MATITIRDLDDDLKARLRVRAAEHGLSMEAEVRAILRTVLQRRSDATGLGSRIHRRFAGLGADNLALPERNEMPRAADLSE